MDNFFEVFAVGFSQLFRLFKLNSILVHYYGLCCQLLVPTRISPMGVLRQFLEFKRMSGCSQSTLNAYEYDLSAFNRFIMAYKHRRMKWGDLSPTNVATWISGRSMSPAYKARSISSLKSFTVWASENGISKIDTLVKLRAPKVPRTSKITLSEHEIRRLLAYVKENDYLGMPGRDYAIIALLCGSGIRLSEVLNLKVVDYDGSSIRVKRKGGKVEILPISQSVKAALDRWFVFRAKIPGSHLFISNRLKPMSDQTLRNIVKTWAERSGVSKTLTPHGLRHSFATLQLELGTPLPVIQRLMGHESISTTERYLHIEQQSLKRAVNGFEF